MLRRLSTLTMIRFLPFPLHAGVLKEYYEVLRQPIEADVFVDGLKDAMQAALGKLDEEIPKSPAVRLLAKGNGWISLSPLEAQSEPPNLARLKSEVAARWRYSLV